MIPMSISEIIDRYTICLLKSERTDEDMSEELEIYSLELDEAEQKHFDYVNNKYLHDYIDELYEINGQIWDLESAIRQGCEGELGLEEVGRRAIEIRNKNKERVAIKNKIVEMTGTGFKDIKVNHGADDGN